MNLWTTCGRPVDDLWTNLPANLPGGPGNPHSSTRSRTNLLTS